MDEQREKIAEVLKAHQTTTDWTRHEHICGCGLKFHFVDAKAWHRHAAAMVVKVLCVSSS